MVDEHDGKRREPYHQFGSVLQVSLSDELWEGLIIRTDHFVSAATGHQQSNRGGGSAGAATYWEVRNAKMAEQNRAKVGLAKVRVLIRRKRRYCLDAYSTSTDLPVLNCQICNCSR